MALIIQKYGGATIDTTAKIGQVANRIEMQKRNGDKLVVVVSAMGKTTDNLIGLAHELTNEPSLREMDTLLNTGEMVSMALLSIALNARNCSAVGLCGYQAGIETDRFFSNASIAEIDTDRINQALTDENVVIVAGFQGQTAEGELTTLGRGGSDTTALALAAALKADRCEILKDVAAIYSADPRIVAEARPLSNISYDALLEMTYWGAKVLQYRSVEIAKHFQIPLYVGPAHSYELGTLVKEGKMIEDSEILSLNSHETVLQMSAPRHTLIEALSWLKHELDGCKISFPQLLSSELINGHIELFLTGPKEVIESILHIPVVDNMRPVRQLSSITATCRGATRPETMEKVVSSLEAKGVQIFNLVVSSMSVTVFVEKALRVPAIQLLHNLIPIPTSRPQLAMGI